MEAPDHAGLTEDLAKEGEERSSSSSTKKEKKPRASRRRGTEEGRSVQCKTATSQEEARFIRKHGLQEEKFDLHGSFTDEEAATAEIYASPRPAAEYPSEVHRGADKPLRHPSSVCPNERGTGFRPSTCLFFCCVKKRPRDWHFFRGPTSTGIFARGQFHVSVKCLLVVRWSGEVIAKRRR